MRALLFFAATFGLTLGLIRGHIFLGLGFGVGVFHRFAVFLCPFGADLGPLLAFFIEYLFAAQQFDERLFRTVALAPGGANNARIAALRSPKRGATVSKSLVTASPVIKYDAA